jgi:transcriptional regulator with GAF, ATPase, and Fis domain
MGDRVPDKNGGQDTLTEFKIILNLINRICSIRETNHIMDIIISELISVTDSDQGVINLISAADRRQLSTVVRVVDRNENVIDRTIGDSIAGWVIKNRQLLCVENLDNDDRFKGLNSVGGIYQSMICSPMIVRGDLIGLITLVRNSSKSPYDADLCRLVGVIASQAGQVLSNAKLVEELAESNRLLEVSFDKLKDENMQLKTRVGMGAGFENIIGKSKPMKEVLTLTSKCSMNDSSVLITGETGTGKELIARAIHYNSERKDNSFVVINCSIKTETLLESELFGHVRGAFTGAVKNKVGLFKEADRGTIFLDEIGDAPLSTQAAILRVIQNGEIKPLGSTKTEIVNVRVISATNKNLSEEIKKKTFREDLYYRLATFHIELPPLRERRNDIPLLVNHYLKNLGIKLRREDFRVDPEALDVLINYSWPGNIRQLENEMERIAVTCDADGVIKIKDLSQEFFNADRSPVKWEKEDGDLKKIIENVEREVIKAALARNRGNISKTSESLGLTRKGLTNKISRYNIEIDFK